MINLEKISGFLKDTPTMAYSAPHDYPHAAEIFKKHTNIKRDEIESDIIRLYLHIPFCNYACSYCCYAKTVNNDELQKESYVSALIKEIDTIGPDKKISQFFICGGTPTAINPVQLNRVLDRLSRFKYADDRIAHTIETSPESISLEHLKVIKNFGVKRVSMGIQSLNENILEVINRKHTHEKTIEACNLILNQGFILNIDLIYGLPGQTMKSFEDDLNLLAKIGVPSFTVYNLRINQNTKIVKKFKDDELLNIKKIIEWRNFIKKTAENLDYEQTRWHTFKKINSNANEHKRLPTSDQDVMGYQFGAGVSARSSINHKVYRNISNIKEYIQRVESGISPVDEIIHLGQEDLKTIHISRTLGDGNELDMDDYKEIFNTGFYSDFPGVIDQLITGELLELSGSKLKLSDEGKSLYDIVTLAFYPKEVKQSMLERLDNFHYT